MRRIAHVIAGLAILATTALAVAQSQTPDGLIRDLYEGYGVGPNSETSGVNSRTASRFFDRKLLALYKRAVASEALDFDFFVNGQDFSLVKPIEINNISSTGTSATVAATLTQNDAKDGKPFIRRDDFVFTLVNTAGGWRLHDATSGGKSVTDEWNAMIKGAK